MLWAFLLIRHLQEDLPTGCKHTKEKRILILDLLQALKAHVTLHLDKINLSIHGASPLEVVTFSEMLTRCLSNQHRQRVNRQNRIPSSFIKPRSSESVSSRPINHDQPVFYALSTVLRVGTRGSLPNLCSILPLTTSQNSPDMWSKTPNFMVGNKLRTVKCTVGVLKRVQMFKLSMAHLFKSYFGILLRPTFPAGFSLDQDCIDI